MIALDLGFDVHPKLAKGRVLIQMEKVILQLLHHEIADSHSKLYTFIYRATIFSRCFETCFQNFQNDISSELSELLCVNFKV